METVIVKVTGQLVALVISSPRTAGQLVAKTRRQNEKVRPMPMGINEQE